MSRQKGAKISLLPKKISKKAQAEPGWGRGAVGTQGPGSP